MKVWKVLGLAGLAGVAATGVVVVGDTRRRAQLTPEQVRERLHAKLTETSSSPNADASADAGAETTVPAEDRPANSHRRRWRITPPKFTRRATHRRG